MKINRYMKMNINGKRIGNENTNMNINTKTNITNFSPGFLTTTKIDMSPLPHYISLPFYGISRNWLQTKIPRPRDKCTHLIRFQLEILPRTVDSLTRRVGYESVGLGEWESSAFKWIEQRTSDAELYKGEVPRLDWAFSGPEWIVMGNGFFALCIQIIKDFIRLQ